ncbi:nucleoside deaminase [Herbaspirillum sp. VT-16-41]|uniref:nucleoside deaminase n=1 Tax=Herbaspirillum sp. VT-16-41 TaxID=1953765 RepID=UPI0009820AA2|nr:nucleoside deaminase [Herbaspirillum sp. VT-16-41]ONN64407.1 tRNA-specific adenosine deaminase [Herbaspirillum sp. VT-16-41]
MRSPAPLPFNEQDHAAMRLAIDASEEALKRGDMPFGATLVAPDGKVLMTAMNNQNTAADCTGHAEMVLVRRAQKELGLEAMRGATVYASGEPCAMCCGAMFWGGIGRVIYAASTAQIGDALGGPQLPLRAADVVQDSAPAVSVEGPLLGAEAVTVLQRFGA